jgi:beta-catenin-like protein 1
MDADLVELLTQNLSRLDEGVETDRTGVYYILSKFGFQCLQFPI